jgi:N-ethylmaleimide reductase
MLFGKITTSMKDFVLLQPYNLHDLPLKNRVVMSAMTRNFADKNHVPTDLMADYYGRRAEHGVGLILTEGTIIHPSGDGYPDVPYIFNDAHIAGWKKVVDKAHTFGTPIFCQLWHCGRISHPDYLGGALPVSSSAVRPDGVTSRSKKPYVTPRALSCKEIPEVIKMFADAARNAMTADFDGVEIHGAHGYLIDQFLDSRINQRTDEYGGSIENRCRFLLEVVLAVLNVAGSERVSLRISPSREMKGSLYEWPDMEAMLKYLLPELNRIGLKILDVSCARSDQFEIYFNTSGKVLRMIRPLWSHTIISGASLTPEQADKEIKNGLIDLATYGRFILANPDFVERIREGKEFVPYNAEMLKTLY